jgi:hypothetical protein
MLLFQYRMAETDQVITERINANRYNDNELLQVQIPLHMPYVINSDFERVDGQIEYKGIQYNYVKRKVSNDTLYLLCLPNKMKTELAKAKSNFTKTVNDIPANKKETGSQVKKGEPTWEYNNIIALYQFNNNITLTQRRNGFIALKPAIVFIPTPAQPPELA